MNPLAAKFPRRPVDPALPSPRQLALHPYRRLHHPTSRIPRARGPRVATRVPDHLVARGIGPIGSNADQSVAWNPRAQGASNHMLAQAGVIPLGAKPTTSKSSANPIAPPLCLTCVIKTL